MALFPEGWFFIKNQSNGYVLSIESSNIGESVVISSLRDAGYENQLWHHGDDGRLYNRKTNFVLGVDKDETKTGTDIVLQPSGVISQNQIFKISSEGHVYLAQKPNLVLGFSNSFVSQKERQHFQLQIADINSKGRKEHRWEFVLSSIKLSPTSNPISSLKRTMSGTSIGSSNSLLDRGDSYSLDEEFNAPLDSFPEGPFFIKSDTTSHFISVEIASVNSPGSRLILESFRRNNYDGQLWYYDAITGRLVNKASGFYLSAEEISNDSRICQSADSSSSESKHQTWLFTADGEVRLKSDLNWVLGFKKDSWFSLGRESTNLLLQRKHSDNKSSNKFTIVLPISKKATSEIVTVSEQAGGFPEGFFFVKNQKNGLVLTILDSGRLAAEAVVVKLDTGNYNHQLWKHNNGFLFNKVSKLVLDIRGGCIVNGAEICHYKQKNKGYENQQWGLSTEGYIHPKAYKNFVLAVDDNNSNQSKVFLIKKKISDNEEQRWNFILPVFKQKTASIAEADAKKSYTRHRYIQYPSGYFFIRSFVNEDTSETPLVLTADSQGRAISLQEISKKFWRSQLWMYWNGDLINFQTQCAMNSDVAEIGYTVNQKLRQASSFSQRWNLTTDGYVVHGTNPSSYLVPEKVEKGFTITLVDRVRMQKEHRWGLLTPKIGIENGIQVLEKWSIDALSEWKQSDEQEVQKVAHCTANWPEQPFFIGTYEDMALVPEKSEAFSSIVIRKLEVDSSQSFKWVYRNGYIVHCATGLVLYACDDIVNGSQLQIGEALLSDSKLIDKRQQWLVKTDGSIVSLSKNNIGFTLIQKGAQLSVQLCYINDTSTHYNWTFLYGHYDNQFNEVYQKRIEVLTRIEKILLTVQTDKDDAKIITQPIGIFPDTWFFIHSRTDQSFVLAAADAKEGSKLTLSKVDYQNFRLQLWRYQDDGCLVNLGSNLVLDVAGGKFNHGSDIIQRHEKYFKGNRNDQLWGLSVDGHIYPKLRPGLVLGSKDGKLFDGVEIQLHIRGSLDLEYQRFTFATPVFARHSAESIEISSTNILEDNTGDIFISKINGANTGTMNDTLYESENNVSLIRRWGVFPEGAFFIRAAYGQERLSLAVERKPITRENGRVEYEVALRPIDFSEYKWHLWTYSEGHLVNVQTSLSLDASFVQGLLLEDRFLTSLFVREKSLSDFQSWSLTANGEIHLRSDERLVIGVSSSERISISGAQIGLLRLKIHKFINENDQQETSLKSEPYLKWVFSKPLYKRVDTSSASTVSTSGSTQAVKKFTNVSRSEKKKKVPLDKYVETGYRTSDDDHSSDNEETKSGNKIPRMSAAAAAAANTAVAGTFSHLLSNNPIERTTDTVIETSKIRTISCPTSATVAFKWLKETYHHKVYQENQWPSFRNWFFICIGNESLFLSSGESFSCEVKFVALGENEDHKRFLWLFINGYLVNYKHMMRLVIDKNFSRLSLSNSMDTLDQHFSISNTGQLSVNNGLVIIYLSVAKSTAHYQIVFSQNKITEKTKFDVQLHVPIYSDKKVEHNSKIAISATILWVHSTQVTDNSEYTNAVFKENYRFFPATTWFFVKTHSHDPDGLVLSVRNVSDESSDLVLKKLNRENYKNQLWAFKDGSLINYNSKLVLDVHGGIKETSKLILSKEANVSSQKWSLTSGSYICLNNYSHFALGFKESLKENAEVSLMPFKQNSGNVVHWHFYVPVFGTYTIEREAEAGISTKTTVSSFSTEGISECIEQGAVVKSVEEVTTRIDDSFVDKSNSLNIIDSTREITKDSHHILHEILKDVEIANTTTGVMRSPIIGSASKLCSKSNHGISSEKSQDTMLQEQSTSLITKNNDTTGTVMTTQNIPDAQKFDIEQNQEKIKSSKATAIKQKFKTIETKLETGNIKKVKQIVSDKTKIDKVDSADVIELEVGKAHTSNAEKKNNQTQAPSYVASTDVTGTADTVISSAAIIHHYEGEKRQQQDKIYSKKIPGNVVVKANVSHTNVTVKNNSEATHVDQKIASMITQEGYYQRDIKNKQNEDSHAYVPDITKKVLIESAIVATGATVTAEASSSISKNKQKTAELKNEKQETITTVEELMFQFNKWISSLTETIMDSIKQNNPSKEEVTFIVERFKTEIIEIIMKTKLSATITENHHVDILNWLRTTAISQATRINDIAVNTSLSIIDIESRCNIVKVITTQEVNSTLQYMKETGSTTTTKFIGASIEQIEQREAKLLNSACRESVAVIQTEKSNTESTAIIIDTVEEIKVKVSSWHKKLSEEINAITIDSTIETKEERIHILTEEAKNKIDRLILDGKLKVTQHCNSNHKITISEEHELLESLEYVKATFLADMINIEQSSMVAIKKSNIEFDQSNSSAIKSSGKNTSHFTSTTTTVIDSYTESITAYDAKKNENTYEAVTDKWAIDVGENSRIISEWFELYIKHIIDVVNKKDSSVMKNIELVSQNAQNEINEMISTACATFKKRLTFESIDQETYDCACRHYEEGLNSVRDSILNEIYEAKIIASNVYTTGKFECLVTEMADLTTLSVERINIAIGSSVMITQKAQLSQSYTTASSGSALQITISDEDATGISKGETFNQELKETERAENEKHSTDNITTVNDVYITNIQEVKKTEHAENNKHSKDNATIVKVTTVIDEDKAVTQEVYKTEHADNKKHSKDKVTTGVFEIGASTAVTIAFDNQKSKQAHDTTVEIMNKSSIKDIQARVDQWLSSLSQEVITCTKRGGNANEVKKIVDRAQDELQEALFRLKNQDRDMVATTETHHAFSTTLEWIKNTVFSQSNQIYQIASQSSPITINICTQIENHILATKTKINSGLEIQLRTPSTIKEIKEDTTKLKNTSEITMIDSKGVKEENATKFYNETREQVKERIRLEISSVVDISKAEINDFFTILMESITTILNETSGSIRKEIYSRLDTAESELEVLIREVKQKFATFSKKTFTPCSESETQQLVLNSVKQTQVCIESVKNTIKTQVAAIREIFTLIEAEDIQVIVQRVSTIIERTKQRVNYALNRSINVSIEYAFEGKVAVLPQTPLQLPESFKNVRVFAFDIIGTVANYRRTLSQVWKKIIASKKNATLSQIDFGQFIQGWFNAYIKIRDQDFAQKRLISDKIAIHQALVRILDVFYIKDYLTKSEIEELCEAWRKLDIYEDVNIGIQCIRNQVYKKYVTVAVSDAFSTQSMIELAQHGCLCWNAQFSFDMFVTQSKATASESVLDGTISLLGLDNANQLAVVSCNPQFISVAKKQGCHVVMVERNEESTQTNKENIEIEVDVKVNGLDIFGESIESYIEHVSMTKTSTEKRNRPKSTSVYWFSN